MSTSPEPEPSTPGVGDAAPEQRATFQGREWVLQRVLQWVEADGSRGFLITGEPGTGKSMVAERLVDLIRGAVPPQELPAPAPRTVVAAHFCRAASDVTLDPLRFIEAISSQLAQVLPSFLDSLRQTSTNAGGSLNVGSINVHAEGAAPGATVAGVVVKVQDMAPRTAFDRLIRRPIHEADLSNQRVVVLVDGLDEAVGYSQSDTVPSLVAAMMEDPELPPQLRVVVTSRGDPRVVDALGTVTDRLDLHLDQPAQVDDVGAYVADRLSSLPAQRRDDLTRRVSAAAAGNFLYARYVVDDLLSGDESGDVAQVDLPRGLVGVYTRFFERELGRADARWQERLRPILGALAVARDDGLTADELAAISRLPRSSVDDSLRLCDQYLSGPYPAGPFRLYHHSFREFLLGEGRQNIYPTEAHAAIADWALSTFSDWLHCDDQYVIRHLPLHLAGAQRGPALHALLLNLDWLRAKTRLAGSIGAATDFDLAVGDPALETVQGAIRLAHEAIDNDPAELDAQLVGRLRSTDLKEVNDLVQRALGPIGRYRLMPRQASLTAPTGPLIHTRTFTDWGVEAVALTEGGFVALMEGGLVSLSWDGVERSRTTFDLRFFNVILSEEGRRFITYANEPAELLIGNTSSGELSHKIVCGSARLTSVATAAGRVAAGASDGVAQCFDLETGEAVGQAIECGSRIGAVALTRDGRYLLCACDMPDFPPIRLFDVLTGETVKEFERSDWVSTIACRDNGRTAVLSSNSAQLIEIDLETGETLYRFDWTWGPHQGLIGALALIPGSAGVVLGLDNDIGVVDLAKGEVTAVLHGHSGIVSALAVAADGDSLVSGSLDNTIRIWSLSRSSATRGVPGHEGPVISMVASGDGRLAVTGSEDGTIRLWNTQSGEPIGEPGKADFPVTALAATPDARLAASACGWWKGPYGRDVYVWDIDNGLSCRRLTGHTSAVECLVAASERLLITGSGDGGLQAWDPNTGGALFVMRADAPVVQLAMALGGGGVLAGATDGSLRLFSLKQEHTSTQLVEPCGSPPNVTEEVRGYLLRHVQLAVTAGGTKALWATGEPALQIIDIASGQLVARCEGHEAQICCIVAFPDGHRAATGSRDGTVRIWNTDTGAALQVLRGHRSVVWSLAVLDEGSLLASASDDDTVRLWDVAAGKQVAGFTADGAVLGCVQAGPDTLMAGDAVGSVHFLEVQRP